MIVGLFIQQAIALFVLKTGAGFSLFRWIANLAADFLNQAKVGAQFFFDADTITKGWFFVNTVRLFVARCLSFADFPWIIALRGNFLHSIHTNDVLRMTPLIC